MPRSFALSLAFALLVAAAPAVQAVGAAVDLPAQDPQVAVCHKGLKDAVCSFIAGVPFLGITVAEAFHGAATFGCAVAQPLKEVHHAACA